MSSRSSSPASPRPTPDLADAHILVVDDRPNDLRLTEILRAARCRISVAFDGLQAYHRAQAIAPDLILMDVRMPRMDGFAACRLLASTPSTQSIPVIILTAAGDLEDRIAAETGAIDYIIKPFEPTEVLADPQSPETRAAQPAVRASTRAARQPGGGPRACGVRGPAARPAPSAGARGSRQTGRHARSACPACFATISARPCSNICATRARAMHFLAETSMGIGDIAEIGFPRPATSPPPSANASASRRPTGDASAMRSMPRPPHPARTITMGATRHGQPAVARCCCSCSRWPSPARRRAPLDAEPAQLDAVSVFEDASTTMSAAQVAARLADPAHGTPVAGTSSFNVEFSRSAWWIRATLTNRDSAARPLVLVIRDAASTRRTSISAERRVDTRQPLPGGRRQ